MASKPPAKFDIRAVVKAIEDHFTKIGTDKLPTTKIPAGTRNNSPEAMEFFVADILRKLANTRFEEAKKKAVESGVFGVDTDYIVGDAVITWSAPAAPFMVSVKLGKSGEMLDKDKMLAALIEALGEEKGRALLAKGMKERKGPVTIVTSIKG